MSISIQPVGNQPRNSAVNASKPTSIEERVQAAIQKAKAGIPATEGGAEVPDNAEVCRILSLDFFTMNMVANKPQDWWEAWKDE
ncbi:hypothetical protein GTU79_25360 [Sodalis ligni]|uniref:hypothetical protein n=1 Tax=Sodalis ligni TaxID=2697027 RepID=UPI00193F6466|nr:hypothetical protein [Sodalis ligni]QWA10492.1 hypothetical protein GTU79_25360 [Sodalis ligni]